MKIRNLLCLVMATFTAFNARYCMAGFTNPFYGTLAWTRYTTTPSIAEVADTDGSSYVITEIANNSSTDLYVTRYDAAGNAAFTKLFVTLASQSVALDHMIVSPSVAGKKYILLQASGNNGQSDFTSYVKLDLDGNRLGLLTFTNPDGTKSLNIGADANGNVYIAIKVGTSNQPQLLEYDASQNLLHDVGIPDFVAYDARFVAGKWFLNGFATDQPPNSIAWRFYSPGSATMLAQAKLNSLDNGTTTYTYNASDYCDNNGAVYWGVNVTGYTDANPSHFVQNHFLRCYTATGIQVWGSKSFPDALLSLTGPGLGGPLWTLGFGNATYFFEQFDLNGNRAFIKTFAASDTTRHIVSDSTGAYLYYSNVNKPVMTVQRVNLNGDTVYSDSFAPINGSTLSSKPIAHMESNGSLYVCGFSPDPTRQAVIKRYVTGVTLASVSGASTVKSGTNYTLKVQLNAPAPSGGIKVDLRSNSAKLLFPNNLTTSSIAIPAGSIYANVVMKAGTVSANTPVVVKGVQNGVTRQVTVTVTP